MPTRSPVERLAGLQRWMFDAIAAEEQPLPGECAHRILPSRSLAPEDRLDIYRGMYRARLEEALLADFPLLARSLGAELFTELAALYTKTHPSESYTLNRLGDRLPAFLSQIVGLPRRAFHQDLARYELAHSQVFDAEELTPCPPPDIASLSEAEVAGLRFTPIPALRALSLRFDVLEAEGWRRPRQTHLILFRRNFEIFTLRAAKPQMTLFRALAEGLPLDAASQSIAPHWIQTSLTRWLSEGLFSRIESKP
jgi:hypothetical protein